MQGWEGCPVTSYGVLGVGSIATAIVTGLCDGVVEPPEVVLSPRNAERAAELAARLPSVRVATDNQQVVDDSDVVVVCLLPIHAADVLAGLSSARTTPCQRGSRLSGLAAGRTGRASDGHRPKHPPPRRGDPRQRDTGVPGDAGGNGAVRPAWREHGDRRRAGL